MRANGRQTRQLNILNKIVFPCVFGAPTLIGERPQLEGVVSAMCAKEIDDLLTNGNLTLDVQNAPVFETHGQGKDLIKQWAALNGLDWSEEIDVSVGVVDVLVHADDTGIFEIGNIKPAKIALLLRLISKLPKPFTVHLWPYEVRQAFVFRNWK